MKRILVTGGAGYVGCILVKSLLRRGFKVRVIDNLMYNQCVLLDEFHNKNFEYIKGSITNKETINKSLIDVDMIIHLAAIVGGPACNINPESAKKVNFEATKYINKVRGDIPIIYPSTGSVYGKLTGMCYETSPTTPLSLYSETKLMSENEIIKKGNYVIFRPATAFGLSPRMRLDLLPNNFTYEAVKLNYLVMYEHTAKRTFIHVRDFARGLEFAIDNFDKMKDNIYNLGNEKLNCTKMELADIINNYHKYYIHCAEIETDPDMRDYEVSYKKLRDIGFDTTITLEEGIEEIIRASNMLKISNPYSNYMR